MTTMHDSGKRQEFEGGAVRDTAEGKLPYSLLPPYAWAAFDCGECVRDFLLTRDVMHMEILFGLLVDRYGLDRFVAWLEKGSKKYDRFNWAKGMNVTRCLDSLGRHMRDAKAGRTDEDHEAASLCNIAFIIHYLREIEAGRLDPKWDDRFDFRLYNKEAPDAAHPTTDV